jgi:nucleotide-binding universal stress UspA family protein
MTWANEVAEFKGTQDSVFLGNQKDKKLGMKILLAVDDSEYSEAATQLAAAQIRPDNAEVLIVSVLYPATDVEEQHSHIRHSRNVVQTAGQALQHAGFKVETEVITVEEGDVRDAILDVATKWEADLIVVGSHGSHGVRHFLLGGVSENVARHAPCSVLVVRPSSRHKGIPAQIGSNKRRSGFVEPHNGLRRIHGNAIAQELSPFKNSN